MAYTERKQITKIFYEIFYKISYKTDFFCETCWQTKRYHGIRNQNQRVFKMKLFQRVIKDNHERFYLFGMQVYSHKPKIINDGLNNTISVPADSPAKVQIHGNNNTVILEDNMMPCHADIVLGRSDAPVDNCTVHIGKRCSMGGLYMQLHEDGSEITIGDDCMFAFNIRFWTSDMHSIINENGEVTNICKHIKIGKHVWLGANVTICKNTEIADNCIVGTQSVVAGKFTKPNCILAGNPARVVKENVKWDRRFPKQYLADFAKK